MAIGGNTHVHTHPCDCGRYWLVCTQHPDQCDIRHFVCPKCQDDQLEADIIQLANEQEQDKTNESI